MRAGHPVLVATGGSAVTIVENRALTIRRRKGGACPAQRCPPARTGGPALRVSGFARKRRGIGAEDGEGAFPHALDVAREDQRLLARHREPGVADDLALE